MTRPAIEVRGLTVEFPRAGALFRDLTFDVVAGEILAVMGPSGCGKTTLLRVLADLTMPKGARTGGEIMLEGASPDVARRAGLISHVFQEPTLLPHLDVLANASFPDAKTSAIGTQARQVLSQLGLGSALAALPRELSGGMRTRVALARAVIRAKAVLLLDEPFASLDVGWRHTLYRQLRQVSQQRRLSVVLVTHDVGEVVELADRALVFAAGDFQPRLLKLTGPGSLPEPQREIRRLLTEGHPSDLEGEVAS